MKKITAFLTALFLLILTLLPLAALPTGALGGYSTEYQFHIESFTADGYPVAELGGGKLGDFIYYEEKVVFHESLVISGWMASLEGNYRLEYSIDNGKNWIDGGVKFTDRKDLTAAGIPYPESHASSAFSVTIPSSVFTPDEEVFLDLRVVTLEENYIEFLSFKSVTYVAGEVEFRFQYRVSLDGVGNGTVLNKGGANTTAEAEASINAGEDVSILGWAVSNLGIYEYSFIIDGGAPLEPGDNLRKRGDVLNAFPVFTAAQGNGGQIGFGRDDDYLIIPGVNRLPAGEHEVILRAMVYDEKDTTFDVMKMTITVTGELPETDAPTEAPTDAPTEAPTAAPTEAPTAPSSEAPDPTYPIPAPGTKPAEGKNGCKSAVVCGLTVLAVLGTAYVCRKK